MIRNTGMAAIVLFAMIGGEARAGVEATGNTDGVVTWKLGTIAPGGSAREVVLLAFAESHGKLIALLEKARRDLATLPPAPKVDASGKAKGIAWLRNDVTDLGLEDAGWFWWEGSRQALTCKQGGQLSRFGYYVHYNDGKARRAGTHIREKGKLENLRVVRPMHHVRGNQLLGLVETADGALRVRIRGLMGKGPVAAVEFVVTNTTQRPIADVRLSAYANLEARNNHENDYGILDAQAAGVVFADVGTQFCAVLTGLKRPNSGHAGTWASFDALQAGKNIPYDKWPTFGGIDGKLQHRLARASIPHPPAPYVEPEEPKTRTLSPDEAREVLERDWIFQAEGEHLLRRAHKEVFWAIELAMRLRKNPNTPDLSPYLAKLDALLERIDTIKQAKPQDDTAKEIYFAVRRIKREMMLANPVVDFSRVLFIDQPYPQGAEWPHEARHRNGMMAVPGGRLLVLDGLGPHGKLRKLAPEEPGSFWRPDLSFDAKRVLFCYKPHDEKAFHLYEIGIDGTGLRRLTDGRHDDIDPIYLPDGHIVFCTTRCNTYVRCMPYTYTYVLARCDADGSNIYILSRGNEPDWCPALLHDGRVVYSRWEYTDKALWRIQSLWTTNQDGTNTATFWGNQSVWPDHLAEARPIPNSPRIMFTGLAHHDWFAGSIGIIDPREGFNFPHGLTKVTRDVEWPECGTPPVDPAESYRYHSSGKFEAYKTPWPLSEEDFLVSARYGGRTGKFRLYLMDVYGNRELLYEGAHNIWHAIPVKPRERPPVHADRVAWPGTGKDRKPAKPGVLFSSDVYEGMPEVPRGTVKYLRVLQLDSKTSSTWKRDGRFSGPATSAIQDDGVKRILGTVPVERDGSVHFKVPAGKALHLQLLDEHYRAVQTMRSFTGVMPGEKRGCLGCHELHSRLQPNALCVAMTRPPREIEPPPWGAKSISYVRMIQPIFDKYCSECHQGDGPGKKKLDLTLRPGNRWFFKEPYLTLVGDGWMHKNKFQNRCGIAGALMCENYDLSDPNSYMTFAPMQHLSYTSRLVNTVLNGKHHDVQLDPVSLRTLIGWIDANCPYRGEEDIRALPDPRFAGIEWLPVRPRTKTAPEVPRP